MIIAVGILKYGNFCDQFVRPADLLHISNSRIAIPRAGGRFSGTIQAMGFNRRKMEDERRRLAEKQAAERRATDPQIIEDAEPWLPRGTSARKSACRCCSPYDRCRDQRALLVSMGVLPGVPDDQRD
jgi:hypothetical protein